MKLVENHIKSTNPILLPQNTYVKQIKQKSFN